jgi:hypothetical protein
MNTIDTLETFRRDQGEKTHIQGLKSRSPLTELSNYYDFDIILDSMLDPMHILQGFIQRHLLKLLKGEKVKQIPGPAKIPETEQYADGMTMNAWMEKQKEWTHGHGQLSKVDLLYEKLELPGGYAPVDKLPMARTGNLKYTVSLLKSPLKSQLKSRFKSQLKSVDKSQLKSVDKSQLKSVDKSLLKFACLLLTHCLSLMLSLCCVCLFVCL